MKTLRVFLSACLSLSFLYHPSFALAKTSKSNWESYNQFFKQTGITKKEVKFSEFFAKTKDLYPEPLRKELEAFVKENPDVKLPKFAISKLKDSDGNENIELRYSSGSESNSVTLITGDNPVYKIGNRKIGYPEILLIDRVAQLLTSSAAKGSASTRAQGLVQTNTEVMQKMPVLLLLSAEDFKKLPEASQRQYMTKIRELAASLESTGKAFEKKKILSGKKQKTSALNLLLPSAFAAGSSCMIGGWSSQNPDDPSRRAYCAQYTVWPWDSGQSTDLFFDRCNYCGRDDQRLAGSCQNRWDIQCNPSVYGESAPCVNPRKVVNVTAECNRRVPDVMLPFRNKKFASMDEFNKMLADAYSPLETACRETVGKQQESADSKAECESLYARIKDVREVGYCSPKFTNYFSDVSGRREKIKSLCEADHSGAGATGDASPADAEGAVLPDSYAGAAEVVRCEDYSGYQLRDLNVDENCGNKIESFDCNTSSGAMKNVIACNCGTGQPMQEGGVWKCLKASANADAGGASYTRLWQQNKSWIKPTVVAAAFIAFMFAIRKSNEKATDLYYRRLQPVNPQPSTPAPAPPATAPQQPPAARGVN